MTANYSTTVPDWITAVATAGLFIYAAIQLNTIRRTSTADFIHRLNSDLFTDESRNMLRLLTEDSVACKFLDGEAIFSNDGLKKFDGYDLDAVVLGPLEAIASYEAKQHIKLSLVYDMFSWYIIKIWESAVVKEYVQWVRQGKDGWDIYDHLERLYKKCKKYGEKKEVQSKIWICEIQ